MDEMVFCATAAERPRAATAPPPHRSPRTPSPRPSSPPLLVRLALRGGTGTSVPSLLGACAVFVLFLALNGVAEAFAAAAADATRLRTTNAQLAAAAVVCAALRALYCAALGPRRSPRTH